MRSFLREEYQFPKFISQLAKICFPVRTLYEKTLDEIGSKIFKKAFDKINTETRKLPNSINSRNIARYEEFAMLAKQDSGRSSKRRRQKMESTVFRITLLNRPRNKTFSFELLAIVLEVENQTALHMVLNLKNVLTTKLWQQY